MFKSLLIIPLLILSMSSSLAHDNEFELDQWMLNPLSKYVTEEQWKNIADESYEQRVLEEKQARMFGEGKIITVDTRDQKECRALQESLRRSTEAHNDQLDELCIQNEEKPFTSFVVVGNQYRRPISLDGLSESQRTLARQTRNFAALGAATIGLIWVLPESVSKWDKEEITSTGLGEKWKQNVKAGPVVDKDDWVINYIGHPVSGAAYYTIARHAGFNKMASFGYSVVMSTFFWEYGMEAFAETPSIQDLLITPILGSLMGEAMFSMGQKIKKNGGKLFGSERVGGFAMGLMNPAGAMLDGINNLFDYKFIKASRTYIYTENSKDTFGNQYVDRDNSVIGIGIELKF